MAGFEGMDRFIKRVQDIPENIEKKGKEVVQDVAQTIIRNAVNNLRINGTGDTGGLMQSITAIPKSGKNGLWMDVYVAKNYAPSMEFGTKGRVDFSDQPANLRGVLQEYASQFKGTPKGTWDEFVKEITAWVKRKGITGVYSVKTRKRLTGKKYNNDAEDRSVAFLIARSIYIHGIPARPFFFPAVGKGYLEYKKQIEELLKTL